MAIGMNLSATTALLAALTVTRVASADPGPVPSADQPVTAPGMAAVLPRAEPAQPVELKSEHTALAWSLGGTAISAAMFVGGMASNNNGLAVAGLLSSLVTPSFGELYAGRYVTVGMGLRAAGLVALAGGLEDALLSCSESGCHGGETLMAVGAIGVVGGALYDIATAPRAARSYNEAHARHLTFAPTALRSGSSTVYGVGVGGSF